MVSFPIEVLKSKLAWGFGWLLTLAGLILPGMQVLDAITTKPAVAKIEKLGRTCSKQVCTLGKCRWKRISCKTARTLETTGVEIRYRPMAKLAFAIEDGTATAWASYSKLEIKQARIGDRLAIIYRGPKPYYVARPFSLAQSTGGLLITIVGLMLLASGRNTSKQATLDRPAPRQQPKAQSAGTFGAPGYRRSVERNTGWL